MVRVFSAFLPGARDTRPLTEIAAFKLSGLQQLLAMSDCIRRPVRNKIANRLRKAVRSFEDGSFGVTIDHLERLALLVQESGSGFVACTDNLAAGFRARARSAIFTLTKLPLDPFVTTETSLHRLSELSVSRTSSERNRQPDH
jgi:hypothetical protein